MKINKEDVVQSALLLERWCKSNCGLMGCTNCPFYHNESCFIDMPHVWNLETKLKNRGLHNGN